jgi:hypothetical protein
MSHSRLSEHESKSEERGTSEANTRLTPFRLNQIPFDGDHVMETFLNLESRRYVKSEREILEDHEQRLRDQLHAFDAQFNKAKPSRISSHSLQAPNKETKKQGIKDAQNEPTPERELHLTNMIDDLVNNILHSQPDEQACGAILTLLPQLLLLFTIRGHCQSKTPAERGMWLFVEKNRQ